MVVLDIETLDFFRDPEIAKLPREEQIKAIRMGVAVTATLTPTGVQYMTWWPEDIGQLVWHLIEYAPICGWNINGFDIPIVGHELARQTGLPLEDILVHGSEPAHYAGDSMEAKEHLAILLPIVPTVDLFAIVRERIGRWYKLEEVAQATLGRGKSADGQQAAEWLRQGDKYKAADYCRQDVELETALLIQSMTHDGILLPAYNKRGDAGPPMAMRLQALEYDIIVLQE